MYAVIESGGKQHRVTEGEVLKLEKIEASTGDKINFDKVLMVGEGADVKIGTPYVEGNVTAEIISHGRGDKVKIIKFQRRKHHQKQMGHRQWFTEVKITEISSGAKAAPKKAAAPTKEAAPVKEAAPKAAAKKATPTFASIVQKGQFAISTLANVAALKYVDLPTFGLPTKPMRIAFTPQ